MSLKTIGIHAELEYYHDTVKRQLEEKGLCGTCGRKTHKVLKRRRRLGGLWKKHRLAKKVPLTIPGQVLKGRCLVCRPIGRAEEPTQDLIVTTLPDTVRTHASMQYELPPDVPLPRVRFRVQGSEFAPRIEKNERGETTKYYLMERGAPFGIELQNMGQAFVQAQVSVDGERAGLFDLAPGVEYSTIEQPFHVGERFKFDTTKHGDGDDDGQTIECIIVPMALMSVRLPDQMTCFVLWDPQQTLCELCDKVLHRSDTKNLVAFSPHFGDPMEGRDWIDARDHRFSRVSLQNLGLTANGRVSFLRRPAYLKWENVLAHKKMLARTDDILAQIYASDDDRDDQKEDSEVEEEESREAIDNSFSEEYSYEESEVDDGSDDGDSTSDESSAFNEIALAEVDSMLSSEEGSIDVIDERYEEWNEQMAERKKNAARALEKKKAKAKQRRRAKAAAREKARAKKLAAAKKAAAREAGRRGSKANNSDSKATLMLDGAMAVTLYARLLQYDRDYRLP